MNTNKRLFIIDFDGTLLRNEANVIIRDKSGNSYTLTTAEYNSIKDEITGEIDFSEFESLKNPFPIRKHLGLLKSVIRNNLADKIVIISERKNPEPIIEFLKKYGIQGGVKVLALGKNDDALKAKYVENQILRGYKKILYVDNSQEAVSLVSELGERHEDVKLSAIHVGPESSKGSKGPGTSGSVGREDGVSSKKSGEEEPGKRYKGPGSFDTGAKKSGKKAAGEDEDTLYRGAVSQLAKNKVYNRDTRRDINLKTALSYPKDHPSHIQARNMVKAFIKTKSRQLKQNIQNKQQQK
jgi:hypothetical protein